MRTLSLEPTNRCNRACLHCFRNRADPYEDLPLTTAEQLLVQAKELGIFTVSLTGGEVALYPHLGELLRMITARGFGLSLVTNGSRFEDNLLPLLLEPKVKARLKSVVLSLDGAEVAHDGLRGGGSYNEVLRAAKLCKEKGLPLSLKTTITALNQQELAELVLLGARLGAWDHEFLFALPTPTLIGKNLLPPPEEYRRIAYRVKKKLAGTVRNKVKLVGYITDGVLLNCGPIMEILNVDFQGNLILCCQLSHVTMGDGVPSQFNGEVVADLNQVSLEEGIIRHYQLAANLMEKRLKSKHEKPPGLSQTPCHWCLYHFGKLEWLKEFPDSPWAKELLPDF